MLTTAAEDLAGQLGDFRVDEAISKANTLIEAMGWIRRFRGKTTVIKLGGSLLDDEHALMHILLGRDFHGIGRDEARHRARRGQGDQSGIGRGRDRAQLRARSSRHRSNRRWKWSNGSWQAS